MNLEKEDHAVKGIIISQNLTNKLEHAIFGLQNDLVSHFEHKFNDDNRPPKVK